jgi:hypothetical protein
MGPLPGPVSRSTKGPDFLRNPGGLTLAIALSAAGTDRWGHPATRLWRASNAVVLHGKRDPVASSTTTGNTVALTICSFHVAHPMAAALKNSSEYLI